MRLKTWHLEAAVVYGVLFAVTALTWRWWGDWAAALAAINGWHCISIGARLEEAERGRASGRPGGVDCHAWLMRHWVAKEVLWATYFIASRQWVPLVSGAVFILYPFWRRLYRTRIRPSGVAA